MTSLLSKIHQDTLNLLFSGFKLPLPPPALEVRIVRKHPKARGYLSIDQQTKRFIVEVNECANHVPTEEETTVVHETVHYLDFVQKKGVLCQNEQQRELIAIAGTIFYIEATSDLAAYHSSLTADEQSLAQYVIAGDRTIYRAFAATSNELASLTAQYFPQKEGVA